MTYFYYKPDGRVAMYSEQPIESPLQFIQEVLSDSDMDKLKQNTPARVKNGHIIFDNNL